MCAWKGCTMSALVQGCGRRPQRRFHTRQQPASATGQGTKSRKVERRGCGWRYGDLSVRDVMMVVARRHEAGRAQRRFHTRQQPASATGQGTKSRKVERRGCGWRYGDLSVRDVMMVVAPRHEAGRRRMPRMPIRAAEQPERGPRMAI